MLPGREKRYWSCQTMKTKIIVLEESLFMIAPLANTSIRAASRRAAAWVICLLTGSWAFIRPMRQRPRDPQMSWYRDLIRRNLAATFAGWIKMGMASLTLAIVFMQAMLPPTGREDSPAAFVIITCRCLYERTLPSGTPSITKAWRVLTGSFREISIFP